MCTLTVQSWYFNVSKNKERDHLKMSSHKTKQSLFQCLSHRKTFWEWVKLNSILLFVAEGVKVKERRKKQTNLQAISG